MILANVWRRISGWRPSWGGVRKAFSLTRIIGLVLLASFFTAKWIDPFPVRFARDQVFDWYQKYHPRQSVPAKESKVVIVDIDENSLKAIGQWPWPRNTVRDLVQNLFAAKAQVVTFDIIFAEPDGKSPNEVAKSRPDLPPEIRKQLESIPSNDQVLADLVQKARFLVPVRQKYQVGAVVLGQAIYFQETDAEIDRDPPAPGSVAHRGIKNRELNLDPVPPYATVPNFLGMVRNIPALEDAALSKGMLSLGELETGVIRRVPTLFAREKKLFPSLAIETLRAYNLQKTTVVWTNYTGVMKVSIPSPVPARKALDINTDREGYVWPYFSNSDRTKYISARDVLAGTFDTSLVEGKMVLIGTSATGLLDIRSIPTEAQIPGVEVHAQIIETVLSDQLLNRPTESAAYELALVLAAGLLMIVLVPWVGAKFTIVLFSAIAAGTGYASWYYFSNQLLLFDASFVILATFIIFAQMTYMGYASEEANRKRVKEQFSHYVSPALVNQLMEDPKAAETRKEELTIGFCDIRGFTNISEYFKKRDDPAGLVRMVNRLLDELTIPLIANRGTLDKYMGDCIMGFWNAPLPVPDHARLACKAGLEMMALVKPLNATLAREAEERGETFETPLKVGLGFNSGEVIVGDMGSSMQSGYSVLGDAVNLASRLEGQCKTYAVDCVIGEETHIRVPDYAMLELDLIKVKGKSEPVRIFVLLGDDESAKTREFQSLKESHNAMIAAYREQRWDDARAHIAACREKVDGYNMAGFYDVFEVRIAAFEKNPPGAEWDGVFVATSK